MITDDFTRAARAYAEKACYQDENRPVAEAGFRAGWKAARTYLGAQEPGVQHLWRPGASPSAFCGDESARPWVPVTREESLAVPVCALCHRRAMHESYNLWAAQEPTDAEVEAAIQAIWEARSLGEPMEALSAGHFEELEYEARAALSAARAAQRAEEK